MSNEMDLTTIQHTQCAICSGNGFSDKKQCPGCLGWGCLAFGEPIVACPECDGRLTDAKGRTNCIVCGGTGWFFPLRSPMERTPVAHRRQSAYSLARPEHVN
jgi:hypothetical protein